MTTLVPDQPAMEDDNEDVIEVLSPQNEKRMKRVASRWWECKQCGYLDPSSLQMEEHFKLRHMGNGDDNIKPCGTPSRFSSPGRRFGTPAKIAVKCEAKNEIGSDLVKEESCGADSTSTDGTPSPPSISTENSKTQERGTGSRVRVNSVQDIFDTESMLSTGAHGTHCPGTSTSPMSYEVKKEFLDNEVKKEVLDNDVKKEVLDNEVKKEIFDNEGQKEVKQAILQNQHIGIALEVINVDSDYDSDVEVIEQIGKILKDGNDNQRENCIFEVKKENTIPSKLQVYPVVDLISGDDDDVTSPCRKKKKSPTREESGDTNRNRITNAEQGVAGTSSVDTIMSMIDEALHKIQTDTDKVLKDTDTADNSMEEERGTVQDTSNISPQDDTVYISHTEDTLNIVEQSCTQEEDNVCNGDICQEVSLLGSHSDHTYNKTSDVSVTQQGAADVVKTDSAQPNVAQPSVAPPSVAQPISPIRGPADAVPTSPWKDSPIQFRMLYISGLDKHTTDATMKKYFSQWGKVLSCRISSIKQHLFDRNIGFLLLSSPGDVDAIQNNRPHYIDAKKVQTKRSLPRIQRQEEPSLLLSVRSIIVRSTVYISNKDLQQYFSRFGSITRLHHCGRMDTDRWRTFIEFTDYDPVDKLSIIRHHIVADKECEVKKFTQTPPHHTGKNMQDTRHSTSTGLRF